MPLEHRDFKAWIHCEGDAQILEEFKAGPDPDDERVYTCWIASESGKNFRVYWDSVEKVNYAYRGVVSVDGVETDKFVHMGSHKRCSVSRGAKTGTGDIRPYAFADVILTDDDSYLGFGQNANTDELGNITVKIYLVKAHYEYRRRWARDNRHRPRQEVALYDGAIHEATKKICYHRIILGEAVPFTPSRRARRDRRLVWNYLDQNDTAPHVTFRFMYRPRAFLQAQGIIPTPVCIEATPHKFFLDFLDNNDNITSTPVNYAGRKRKRPLSEWTPSAQNVRVAGSACAIPKKRLFLPASSHLYKSPQTPRCENTSRPVFFATPRPMKKDEDLIFLGYSERKGKIKQDESLDSPLLKRVKLEFMTPIKPESGVRLWMEGDDFFDLTKE